MYTYKLKTGILSKIKLQVNLSPLVGQNEEGKFK